MTVRIPCGQTLGHGESCSADNLCEQCHEILRLRRLLDARHADVERLRKSNSELTELLARERTK